MSYEASMLNYCGSEATMAETKAANYPQVTVRKDSEPQLHGTGGCYHEGCYMPPTSAKASSNRAGYPSEQEIVATLVSAVQASTPDPREPVPPPQTASQSSSRYESLRQKLILDAYRESILGHKFTDVEFRAFSSRSRNGKRCKPLTVHARSAILEAASPRLKGYLTARTTHKQTADRRPSSSDEDDYEDDSDLSDYEDDNKATLVYDATYPPEMIRSPSPHKVSPQRNLLEEAYIGSLIGSRAFNCGSTTPKAAESSHFRPKIDFFDDEDVEDYCTDFSDDVRSIGSVSSKTESLLEDLSDDEAMSVVGTADQVIDAELLNQRVTTDACIEGFQALALRFEKDSTTAVAADDTVVVKDGAYKTWQALLLYLFNDHIAFAPLRSQRNHVSGGQECSPKSMYRLAAKFGLDKLKDEAKAAIRAGLSEQNIVEELCSDFAWRHPEIVEMETSVFGKFVSHPKVQQDLGEVCKKIAVGQYPKSSAILSSIFVMLAQMGE